MNIMDKQQIIELSNQVYGITPLNINSQLLLVKEYLLEKDIDTNKINAFLNILLTLPIEISFKIYTTVVDYYIAKYSIYKLIYKDNVILIY